MNSTHRLVGILAVAALLAAAPARASRLAVETPGDQQQTEKFSKTVPLPKGGSLELSNISGDIVVLAGSGRDATIECTRRGYGDTPEEARRQLALLEGDLTATRARGVPSVSKGQAMRSGWS